jgi:hypothetical protein
VLLIIAEIYEDYSETWILYLVLIWPSLALSTKRWHDLDKSGWWNLINFVPFIGSLWALIKCGLSDGTTGDNRYGSDPLSLDESHDSKESSFWHGIIVGVLVGVPVIIGSIWFFHPLLTSHSNETLPQIEEQPTPFIPVNVNTATLDELDSIPYVRRTVAQAIIDHRPYKTLDDLVVVPGIKERMVERLRPYTTVK